MYLCHENNFNKEINGKPKELEVEVKQVVKDRNRERKSVTLTTETRKNEARQPQCVIIFIK